MRDLIQFFSPLFNSILFNHPNISLVELSFFSSILLIVIAGELTKQKPEKSSVDTVVFYVSIPLFLCAGYLVFCELTWWKSTINIIVSFFVFYKLSQLILFVFNLSFAGLYNLQSSKDGRTLKRSAYIFITITTIFALIFAVLLEQIIF